MKPCIALRSWIISLALAISHGYTFQTSPSVKMSSLKRSSRSNLFRNIDIKQLIKNGGRYSQCNLASTTDPSNRTSLRKPQGIQLIVGRPNGIRHKAVRSISNLMATIPRSSSGDDGDNTLTKISRLEQENYNLKQTIMELERENEALEKSHKRQRIIIEKFEGEDDNDWWDEEMQLSTQNRSAADSLSSNSFDDTCVEFDDGACPIEPDVSFTDALQDRAYWLVGLLTLQSMSGLILAKNEALLQTHPFIVYFLTMLVGAGGNAGNQAAVRGM